MNLKTTIRSLRARIDAAEKIEALRAQIEKLEEFIANGANGTRHRKPRKASGSARGPSQNKVRPNRRPEGTPAERLARAEQLFAASTTGLTAANLSRMLKVSDPTAYDYLRKLRAKRVIVQGSRPGLYVANAGDVD